MWMYRCGGCSTSNKEYHTGARRTALPRYSDTTCVDHFVSGSAPNQPREARQNAVTMASEETYSAKRSRAAPSAYFLFAKKEQATIRQQLANESGRERIPLGEVQKALSEKWRNISSAEREAYYEEARQKKQEYQQEALWHDKEAQERETKHPTVSGGHKRCLPDAGDLFPQARVNKIVKLDPTLARVTAVAARTMNLAMVLALRRFAALADSYRSGRSTLMQEDVFSMIRQGGAEMSIFQGVSYALDTDGSSDDDGHVELSSRADDTFNNSASAETIGGTSSDHPTWNKKRNKPPTLNGDSAYRLEHARATRPNIGKSVVPMKGRKKPSGSKGMQCADISSFFSCTR
ncbi:HMG (high mobility group) box domain-containing protein [Toxoplasma gondii RUB]|uniref:HMG (High mobility group) box domain-containing protein n=4 Tax=Toxoplasma gondii TaxID=5811 RepID=A0A086M788_TOXGO|nr:HMG (high mobility group) box domain-containing protein [Toxoplasma gondii GAB2-2007-GAL-DOM2]KFG50654.1 HMG (high mobility group) box domain-containing protein [Toxoplasma gondii FOU]KFG64756.1 HMG (high mobility group) box domain-containing protein [Toxoplasma gondii RUB]KFH05307.1 HMG (high mobility group) box domain-containing protein [Toxoplasma gondii VAND]